jgi:hypothetical protein
MTKVLVLEKHDCDHLLGQFLDEAHYDTLLDEDCDVYLKLPMGAEQVNDESNVILKFRKNYFTKAEQIGAYDGLRGAVHATQNRGLAAGSLGPKLLNRDWVTDEQIDVLEYLVDLGSSHFTDLKTDIEQIRFVANKKQGTRGMVWLTSEKEKHKFDFEQWLNGLYGLPLEKVRKEAKWVLSDLISDTFYANPVDSGIAGWFDRYPRIPYGRATAYTAQNFDTWKLCYPFMERLSSAFKEFLPKRYAAQMEAADKIDPAFRIPGTPLTTITVNKNFRTAAHRDAGDFAAGFSNLTVVAKNLDYQGGYLILPEIRAAVNIRPGDLLLVSNHEYIHGNTPIVAKEGVELERISLVCYLREKMLELGEKRYEDARFQFVESRRKNQDHKLWRNGWNGISPGMWESDEWYQFLGQNFGQVLVDKYHPLEEESSLEHLFG